MSVPIATDTVSECLRKAHNLDGSQWVWAGFIYPADSIPRGNALAEGLETALSFLGMPWVWYLAAEETVNGFTRLLSRVEPVDHFVAKAVYAYCRSH